MTRRGVDTSKPANVRLAAARVLQSVTVDGRSLTDSLPRWQARVRGPRDQALMQELAYGALRWHYRLAAIRDRLLDQPLRRRDQDVDALLRVGLYQLAFLEMPVHAAVAETVNAAEGLGKPWVKGLLNAVLRRFQRERASVLEAVDTDPVARWAHPDWLLAHLQRSYPEHWQRICWGNNERPPMSLRVNRARTSVSAYLERLEAEGMAARRHSRVDSALLLAEPVSVESLPGFHQGEVSVQDAGAQLAAPLLEALPGLRVLDACAAPGGKAAHVLESARGDLELLAVDIDETRMARVDENLQRLGLSATRMVADAGAPETWWDGQPFDRILIDAPCSGTGVIRRHPDIRVLRRPDDAAALQRRQIALLQNLWPLLARHGILVYVTCSVLPEENDVAMRRFLEAVSDAAPAPWDGGWGRERPIGRQILPGDDDMDGFYYARLVKS